MATRRQQRKEAGRGLSLSTGTDDEAGETTPMTRRRRDTETSQDGPRGDVEMREGPAGGSKEAEPEINTATQLQNEDGKEGDEKTNDPAPAAGGNNRRNRGGAKKGANTDNASNDIENNKNGDWTNTSMAGPFKLLEPIRADPIKLQQTRKNRLERLAVQDIPEIHFVGQITSGTGLIDDATEGVCLRCVQLLSNGLVDHSITSHFYCSHTHSLSFLSVRSQPPPISRSPGGKLTAARRGSTWGATSWDRHRSHTVE